MHCLESVALEQALERATIRTTIPAQSRPLQDEDVSRQQLHHGLSNLSPALDVFD